MTDQQIVEYFLLQYTGHTRSAYEGDITRFRNWLGDMSLFEAKRIHIDAFVRYLTGRSLKPATINRYITCISSFYTYCESEELIVKSPTRYVRKPKVSDISSREGLTIEELRQVLSVAKRVRRSTYALLTLLVLTGLRISEALSLHIDDIKESNGEYSVRVVGKGSKTATIIIPLPAMEAIQYYIGSRSTGPIFLNTLGKPLDRYASRKLVQQVLRRCDIDKTITHHSFRHTFITLALDAGVSLRDVQVAARHSDPKMTARYDRAIRGTTVGVTVASVIIP